MIYRFLKRNGFSYRTCTHVGQPLAKQCFINASIFFNDVWDKRIENRFWDSIIANIDETPVMLNMKPNKTVAKKGKKTILIKSQE